MMTRRERGVNKGTEKRESSTPGHHCTESDVTPAHRSRLRRSLLAHAHESDVMHQRPQIKSSSLLDDSPHTGQRHEKQRTLTAASVAAMQVGEKSEEADH